MTEYWNEEETRWALVDAELDDETRERCGIDFDLLDLPRDRFLVAGDAWQRFRGGELDPNRCGVNEELCGVPFLARYLTHDLAALTGMEVLCWDAWGMTDLPPGGRLNENELALLDAVARAGVRGTTGGFEGDPRLRPEGEIRSYSPAGFRSMTWM